MSDGRMRYEVEIASLADFLSFVDSQVTETLEPGQRRINVDLPHGTHWGCTVGGGLVRAARVSYLHAQQDAHENMARYVGAGATMREVIKRLMEMYRTAEEMAALTNEDVLRIFQTVASERDTPQVTAPFAV